MTRSQVLANTATQLKFFRRNRLLLAGSVVIVGLMLLSSLPSLLFTSPGQRFGLVSQLYGQLLDFLLFFAAGLGLLGVSAHLRSRSYELVVTKPCRPETWLLGHYLAGSLLALLLTAAVFLMAVTLSVALGVPLQAGLIFLAVHHWAGMVVLLGWLTLLGVLVHPLVAGLLALLLRDTFVRWLLVYLVSGTNLSAFPASRALLWVARALLTAIHSALPLSQAYAEEAAAVETNLRVTADQWGALIGMLGYAVAFAALSFAMASLVLRRRRSFGG
jgi:hypothetical protein